MEDFVKTNTNNNPEPVRFGEWFLAIFLMAIPIVGIVMLFVWAFGSNTNPSKANWAKASLLWMAIILVFYIILIVIFGALLFSGMNSSY